MLMEDYSKFDFLQAFLNMLQSIWREFGHTAYILKLKKE